jgi:hypothetical protein
VECLSFTSNFPADAYPTALHRYYAVWRSALRPILFTPNVHLIITGPGSPSGVGGSGPWQRRRRRLALTHCSSPRCAGYSQGEALAGGTLHTEESIHRDFVHCTRLWRDLACVGMGSPVLQPLQRAKVLKSQDMPIGDGCRCWTAWSFLVAGRGMRLAWASAAVTPVSAWTLPRAPCVLAASQLWHHFACVLIGAPALPPPAPDLGGARVSSCRHVLGGGQGGVPGPAKASDGWRAPVRVLCPGGPVHPPRAAHRSQGALRQRRAHGHTRVWNLSWWGP